MVPIPFKKTSKVFSFAAFVLLYLSFLSYPAVASQPLKARGETNWRSGDARSILMGELWLPLYQDLSKSTVLFSDLRFSGDNSENLEFNAGLGYRKLMHNRFLGKGILGGLLWYDGRRTERHTYFNQITIGGEWLTEFWDFRTNGYFPINREETHVQSNPNGSGTGFVGTQVLVNTDQTVTEEALVGVDVELGCRLSFLDAITDATRIYAGGYHFAGDRADDVSGWRVRLAADITSDIQLGGRFQHDDVRKSQGFFEISVRLPFGSKRSFRKEGLLSRLDESPERDIDIVANEAFIDDGVGKTLLNATTGSAQNVIHVDNTAGGGGDGSIETPYNTLAAAEAAAGANDLIYVHRGDGTTTGQNAGITLNDTGQILAGSGVDLTFNRDLFATGNNRNVTGNVIDATTAPMISNAGGDGINVTADDVYITGVTIDGAAGHGIYVLNADNATVDQVTTDNNTTSGVEVEADGSIISSTTVKNITADNNGSHGLHAFVENAGIITTVNFTSNNLTNNTLDGIRIASQDAGSSMTTVNITSNTMDTNSNGLLAFGLSDGDLGTLNITSNTSKNNVNAGIQVEANVAGSTVTTANITSNSSTNNGTYGLYLFTQNSGDILTANTSSNTFSNNTSDGIRVASQDAGSLMTTLNFTNNTMHMNGATGLLAFGLSDGDLGTLNLTNNTSTNNTGVGMQVEANVAGSVVTDVNFTNNVATDNGSHGLFALAQNDGDITSADFTGNTVTSNTTDGIRVQTNAAGSVISATTLSENSASSNGAIGLYVYAVNDSTITQASLEDNTSTGNTTYGIGIDDDSAAGSVSADLGGGSFSSSGSNSVSSNTLEEILVDLDGSELKAENNWWGSASGLAGGEVLLQDGSTIDSSPFLTSNPG